MEAKTEPIVTPERFASGMTFIEYLDYIASPENLAREGNEGAPRVDRSPQLRAWFRAMKLQDHQLEALRWLADQAEGPGKVLAIVEEWSSDCRRDLPMLARMAEAADMELRIFTRDGQRFGTGRRPSAVDSPNADLMSMFLNEKRGKTWQSIPVAAFFTSDLRFLYRYVEYPAIYEKDRVVYGHIRVPQPGETPEETRQRIDREFGALQQSPFFRLWACAAVDEMLSALHRRVVLGVV
jgi:thioredoxin family protein